MKLSQEDRLAKLLQHFEIEYNQQTRNAYNVNCPFCEDSEKHCGVFFSNFQFNCWHCNARGTLFELLVQARGIRYNDYKLALDANTSTASDLSPSEQIAQLMSAAQDVAVTVRQVDWPPQGAVPLAKAMQYQPTLVSDFLARRKFTKDACIARDVHIGIVGRFVNRFLFPVVAGNRVVAFQGRAMTSAAEAAGKYKTEGDVSKFLYNYDGVDWSQPVAITEGVFSSWSTPNSVASFSSSISTAQIALLAKKQPRMLVLCWDMAVDGSDAYWKGKLVMNSLACLFGESAVRRVLLPPKADPDTLGIEYMRNAIAEATRVPLCQ